MINNITQVINYIFIGAMLFWASYHKQYKTFKREEIYFLIVFLFSCVFVRMKMKMLNYLPQILIIYRKPQESYK